MLARESGIVERGEDGALRYPNGASNIVEVLDRAVRLSPDREAVVAPGGTRLTYAELDADARRVAGGLRAVGVSPGARVALDLPNGVEWVQAYWGILRAGGVVVPLNSRLTDAEKAAQARSAGCALTLDDPNDLPYADPLAPDVGPGDPDAVAAIFFTSGTTGEPRGVAMSHRNLWTAAENTRHMLTGAMADVEGHRSLISVPLFHVTGCHSQMLSTVHVLGTSVVMPQFDVPSFLAAIQEERINQVISVPTIFWRVAHHPDIAKTDTSSVTAVLFGGAPVPPELAPLLHDTFPNAALVNGFGCTESTGVLTALPDALAISHSGAIGMPMPAVELRLLNTDETGAGELVARGASIMCGYWKDGAVEPLADRWVSTGDVARFDEDGVLWIVDRVKDRISRGGEKIFSIEVENVLIGAPGVFEVLVVGVPDPDLGERIGVAVAGQDGILPDAADVARYAQEHLPRFKQPEFIHVSDTPLPRNAGGKLLKPRVRQDVDWSTAYRVGR